MKSPDQFKRVLLKLSGETLSTPNPTGINAEATRALAQSVKDMHAHGFEIGIVIGGGNILRGADLQALGFAQTPSDTMGMLATVINGIALQQALLEIECPASVMSAIDCPNVVDRYNWHEAIKRLERKEIVIFVGGTGNPYFTTDTAAALRASQIEADVLLKATKVDGVYDKDPKKFPDAVRFEDMTYNEVLARKLKVMDATSIALCMTNHIPVLVFNMEMLKKDQFIKIFSESKYRTLIHEA